MSYQSDRNTKPPRCIVCGRFVNTMRARGHYTPDSPLSVETFGGSDRRS